MAVQKNRLIGARADPPAVTSLGALFTREEAVETAWAVAYPALTKNRRARSYKRGSWGPREADALIAADGCWFNSALNRE